MGIPIRTLLVALSAGFFPAGCDASAGAESPPAAARPAVTAPGTPDTLALLVLYLATPALDSAMAAESDRLDSLCGVPRRMACSHEHGRSVLLPLAPLEDDEGASVGSLAVHLHVPEHGWPVADFVFLPGIPAESPGGAAPLPENALPVLDPGDWGYGLHFAVREWRDGEPLRVRLPGVGSPAGAWITVRGAVGGWLTDAGEPVWFVRGAEPALREGAYRILSVAGGEVELRGEIPSDMPCELEPPADPDDPPIFRVPLGTLFGEDGRARLEPAYPRGC